MQKKKIPAPRLLITAPICLLRGFMTAHKNRNADKAKPPMAIYFFSYPFIYSSNPPIYRFVLGEIIPYPITKNNPRSTSVPTIYTTSTAGGRSCGGSAPAPRPLPKNRMECYAIGLEKA